MRPFLDRVDLRTLESKRLIRCDDDSYHEANREDADKEGQLRGPVDVAPLRRLSRGVTI